MVFFYRKARIMSRKTKPSCLGFLVDCLLVLFTGGLWLIWIFIREMRNRR